MAKRRRGAGAGPGPGPGPSRAMEREQRPQPEQEQERRPHQKQRLYLVFDDNPFGYSIRRISLSPSTSRQTRSSMKKKKNTAASGGKCPVRRLPCPIFYTEAQRGLAATIAAIGTKILLTQCMNRFTGGDMVMVLQIYDVRHRGVTFGPGKFYDCPIYISIGDKLFVLYNEKLSRLSFEQKQPPPLDVIKGSDDDVPWSWQQLPPPPFHRVDVTSYAVLPDDDVDGQTILVSNDDCPDDPWCTAGTFTFNTIKCEWTTHGDWTLPFTGRAYFVSSLEAFVGLSKDPATLGHLTSCDREAATATGPAPATTWKLSKEKLFSDDPAETHVSATLVYTGRGGGGGSEFCLVQCVSVKPGNGNGENLEEPCYRYRLTTFSLSYDDSGHLTTGNTCSVQCYKVPREATKQFMNGDPVAFWL